MPRLMIKSNGDAIAVESFDLKLGVNRLGRTPDNDLLIDRATVSTLHCEIIWMNDSVVVRDRESTNGTFIDGQRIPMPNPVRVKMSEKTLRVIVPPSG